MCTPSATLTVWAAAWLSGRQAPDDVLEALQAWATRHYVTAADPFVADRLGMDVAITTSRGGNGVATLLKTLRTAGGPLQLLLPVPGDVRGLPVGTAFAADAVDAEEAVLLGAPGSDGVGLVPRHVDGAIEWAAHTVPVPRHGAPTTGLGEAEHSMRQAVREAAEAMTRLRGVATGGPTVDPRELVEAELAAYSRHCYPDSAPLRARRVLDTADHVAAILTVAESEPAFIPASVTGARSQEDLFRPLWQAIREARLVAVYAASMWGS